MAVKELFLMMKSVELNRDDYRFSKVIPLISVKETLTYGKVKLV